MLVVAPADHVVRDVRRFRQAAAVAAGLAQDGKLVTFGIVAHAPETGYGYIRRGEGNGPAFPVAEFIEKPPMDLARQFVASGDYFWNSRHVRVQGEPVSRRARARSRPISWRRASRPSRRQPADLDFVRIDKAAFEKCRSDSIDYAVMEKTRDAVVLPLDAGWSDVGSWASLFDALPADEEGNVLRGDVLVHDTHDCYVHSTSRLVAAVGMDDHVIVETKDAILVAPKERVQDVKDLVAKLKKSGRAESSLHREVFRPWGSYDSLDAGERFQVKRLSSQAERRAVAADASPPRRALDRRAGDRAHHLQRQDVPAVGERVHLHTHRRDPSHRESRQGGPAHRGSAVGVVPGRGRHRAFPGQLRPARDQHLSSITCFKAYDLRGRIPTELNDDVAYRVGRAYAEFLSPKRVVVGRDIRLSSEALTDALCRGLTEGGADVFDIGICGTEGVYFATFDGRYDGGIMVTASHNPPDYNGMKFVREQSKPISGDNGLKEIRALAERGGFKDTAARGRRQRIDTSSAYIEHLLSYVAAMDGRVRLLRSGGRCRICRRRKALRPRDREPSQIADVDAEENQQSKKESPDWPGV